MKVGVIGANGQLGQDIVRAMVENGDQVVELNHDSMDVADPGSVKIALNRDNLELVVNTAAMHDLEKCEQDPDTAFRVNAVGARNVALACKERGVKLVHISTNYVFDGAKRGPYRESDEPLPLNVYGTSKLRGEFFVRTILPEHFVLRVSGLYGHAPCRAKKMNFVELMLKLGREREEVRVVDSEILAPSFTLDVARQITRLAATEVYGLYHVAAHGQCSWHRFAQEIFSLAGINTRLTVADPAEFQGKTPRPPNSVLENHRLQQAGLDIMRNWEESLADYFYGGAEGNLEAPIPIKLPIGIRP